MYKVYKEFSLDFVIEMRKWAIERHKSALLVENTVGQVKNGVMIKNLADRKHDMLIEHKAYKNSNGLKVIRRVAELPRNIHIDKYIKKVKLRFDLPDDLEDSYIGFKIMFHFENVTIKSHTDQKSNGNSILRVNTFLQTPKRGGMPTVMGGELVDVKEGDAWAFIGNDTFHGAAKTRGKIPRVMLCLSFEVSKDYIIPV